MQPSRTLPALNAGTSFRVNPWQILLLCLPSVFFRVNPWQMLLPLPLLILISVANLLLPLILPSMVNLLPYTNLHYKPNLFELNLVLC